MEKKIETKRSIKSLGNSIESKSVRVNFISALYPQISFVDFFQLNINKYPHIVRSFLETRLSLITSDVIKLFLQGIVVIPPINICCYLLV